MPVKGDTPKDLAARHEAESHFHDQKYGQGDRYPRHYAVNPTYPIYQRMLVAASQEFVCNASPLMSILNRRLQKRSCEPALGSMAGDLSGKHVLEYGCGEGWITRDLVRKGAMVSAFDISAEAVRRTREILVSDGVADRCSVAQMGAERLDYPDDAFDMAIGFAIIHHLDLSLAIPELYRVLKPGGVAYFAEPLGSNPLINLYRRLTPQYRTEDEEPLDLKALALLLARFREVEHTDFYITALAAVALAYLPFGRRLYPAVNQRLMKFDDGLLRRFPGLGRLAWYTILTLRK